jgi:two-component system, NtrC family, sensor kinase
MSVSGHLPLTGCMNVRWKVTTLIAALFVILGVAEIFVARMILMPSFAELEHTDANTEMRRINYALDATLDQLVLSATGWGNWADAYRFMQDHDRAFYDENFNDVGLKQLNVNTLIFIDLDGRFAASGTLDFTSGAPFDLDFMKGDMLSVDFPWRANLRDGRSLKGFLQTNQGILMVAAAPILNGFEQGPTRGMVLMGRLLTPTEIEHIGARAQAKLAMLVPPSPDRDRLLETDNITQIYRTLDDIYGHPIVTLRVDVPRNITHRGHLAVNYASAFLAVAAVIVLALLVFVLDRVILNPLARVTRHAVAIGEGKDLSTRLDFKGTDEIGVLAREFDHMVARVAESRSKLADQSFQAGFAELARGVLHNLGNAMTPIGVRLATLRGRVRSAPAIDAELAVEELAQGGVDPVRRADLEKFVHLACLSLASTVKSVESDVEVMSRQTSIVQSALSEQMRATRNEHVVEPVRLNDLIAQSMEVVPDPARQLLRLDADDSLSKVGPVKVARTVMRLVLQNFIINAADAVRESGKSQGSLRIAAEIVSEPERDYLQLHCTDNGIGIAPGNLERIFDKGFSTKSKETNFGIGLHWCANAIAALGGRIWATSDGPGRGASMHLMVPLAARESLPTVQAA